MTEFKQVKDYPINELNPQNTHKGSGVVSFRIGVSLFCIGFWSDFQAGFGDKPWPYLALITETEEGWKVLDRLTPLWNDDLRMGEATPEEDIATYKKYIGNDFSETIQAFLTNTGQDDVVMENWEIIRKALDNLRIEADKIIVP